jgi:hypothetical protein
MISLGWTFLTPSGNNNSRTDSHYGVHQRFLSRPDLLKMRVYPHKLLSYGSVKGPEGTTENTLMDNFDTYRS